MVDYTSRNLGLDPTGKDPSVTTDDVGRVTVVDVVGRNNYSGNSVLRSSPTAVMTCASVRGVGLSCYTLIQLSSGMERRAVWQKCTHDSEELVASVLRKEQ